jgi:protein phosphatase 1L
VVQDAVALIRDIPDAERAARLLTEEALARGSNDNISCVVLKFRL